MNKIDTSAPSGAPVGAEPQPPAFDADYAKYAIAPAYQMATNKTSPILQPMISLDQSKEDALPYYLWGMLYDSWTPDDKSTGSSVFLTGLDQRSKTGNSQDNLRKKIYFSAVTPDLYAPAYRDKILRFLERLFAAKNAGQPFMSIYLREYVDVYWDLHVGVTGDQIPPFVRKIQESFNTVFSYQVPNYPIVYENYMIVRALRQRLFDWIDQKVADVAAGAVPGAEHTFVHYWLANAKGDEDVFSPQDIRFEVFHNFVALSQWAHTVYLIIQNISDDSALQLRSKLDVLMGEAPETEAPSPFPPLIRFVMELFRLLSPNNASFSALSLSQSPKDAPDFHPYSSVPHDLTSRSPTLWLDPDAFNPDRYLSVPTSADIDRAKCERLDMARCPFEASEFKVKDGRNVSLTNSGFGTVYGVLDGKPAPVADYAGFAPFGFGYRRCPGEQLTQRVFEDFLLKIGQGRIEFYNLDLADPTMVPAGPGTVVPDTYAFKVRP